MQAASIHDYSKIAFCLCFSIIIMDINIKLNILNKKVCMILIDFHVSKSMFFYNYFQIPLL